MKWFLLSMFIMLSYAEAGPICDGFSNKLRAGKKALLSRPATYASPVVVGGGMNRNTGPFEQFQEILFKDRPITEQFLRGEKETSDEALRKFLSSSRAQTTSVIYALDLLYHDARTMKGNCSEAQVSQHYRSGLLAQVIAKKIPIILGRIPLLFGAREDLQTREEMECAKTIDYVVHTELCGPHKDHCLWLDLEDFYSARIKDRKLFPADSFVPSAAGSSAIAEDICREMEASLESLERSLP